MGISHPDLRKELLAMRAEDQGMRRYYVRLKTEKAKDRFWPKVKIKDQEHQRLLKTIIDKEGWPTFSMVGKMAAGAAYLVAQHADNDLLFQRRCFDMMQEAAIKNEAHLPYLAFLTDRVRKNSNQPQLYGTQYNDADALWPIKDEINVDKRRASMGMRPLAESLS